MSAKTVLTEKHNKSKEIMFRFKSFLLVGKRRIKNLTSFNTKFRKNSLLKNETVIAFSESDLWNPDDNEQNWILTAGKIENLRIAIQNINGIEIPAHSTFSFWKHIGNPNFGKGYVIGREIREGCIVPTKAGGLCQLSNALYDAALKANFQIIERHRHTQVIKGSLAEKDRDATVKWNYIDLRFRSTNACRIEAELTADKLIISIKAKEAEKPNNENHVQIFSSSKLNDCFSCGNIQCFKHPTGLIQKQKISNTTFILDEFWPEYEQYIQSIKKGKDVFILPLPQNGKLRSSRYTWKCSDENQVKTFTSATLLRSMQARISQWMKKNPFENQLHSDEKVARRSSKLIPVESTHLVVSQNLLPGLFKLGVLAGRTYDVLMTRLPAEKLHERLDLALANHPESKTLNDFRVDQHFIDIENKVLTQSRKIITPHTEIASMFVNKCILLEWHNPTKKLKPTGNRILFPGSTVGRKGAYEMRQLAKEFDLRLLVVHNFKEDAQFWKEVNIETMSGYSIHDVSMLIYPTYIEHQPRFILKALSNGIRVITTAACGLPPQENLTIVSIGKYEEFKQACEPLLKIKQSTEEVSNS